MGGWDARDPCGHGGARDGAGPATYRGKGNFPRVRGRAKLPLPLYGCRLRAARLVKLFTIRGGRRGGPPGRGAGGGWVHLAGCRQVGGTTWPGAGGWDHLGG